MAFDSVVKYVAGEWQVILQAPLAFALCLIVIFGLAYSVARWRYTGSIETLESRIKLRDDQVAEYKQKLSGATPDEAKARLDALEKQISALVPRRLSMEQKNTIRKRINQRTGVIVIMHDLAAVDAKGYAIDFINVFREAGWIVSNPTVMGIGRHPNTGIALSVVDENKLRPSEIEFRSTLEAAGIVFDIHSGLPSAHVSGQQNQIQELLPDFGLLVTTRV